MKNNQIYSGLPIKIGCASLNFKKLDDNSLKILKLASFSDSQLVVDKFRKKLGFSVEQLLIIQKCNAVMVVVVSDQNISTDYLKNCIFDVWDKISSGGIIDHLNSFVFHEDESAVKYLAECALGLNSVTIGDSQVFAQVRNAIEFAVQEQRDNPTLKVLSNWLRVLHKEVSDKTAIFSGNTSLERIASVKLTKLIKKDTKVCVLGLGQSGVLIVKILLEEHGCDLIIANRSKDKILDIVKKYPQLEVVDLYDFEKIKNSGAIVFTLDSNKETIKYFKELIKKEVFSGTRKIIIDLSTPPVCEKQLLKDIFVVNTEDLSIEANKTAIERLSEANKVRQIIDKKFSLFYNKLKTEIGRIHTASQKSFASPRLSPQIVSLIKTRSKALFSIRNYLRGLDFCEINTPYIVGVSTDPPRVDKGGAIEVIWPNGEQAFLRQSNQLYKQMVVVSGVEKVFEIGPFWRAETENTFRHLEESIGLDVEFSSPKSLKEVMLLAYSVIFKVFEDLKSANLASFEVSLPEPNKLPIITYEEAIELLNKNGFLYKYGVDLGVIGEAKLGEIIQKRDHGDAFAISHYPSNVKKFYTKQSASFLTQTFDIIVGGWELVSGALREVNRNKIEHSMKLSGVNPRDYNFYLSIVDNAIEHGGFGLGVDRLMAKLLNIDIISDAVAFPRTFDRLIP